MGFIQARRHDSRRHLPHPPGGARRVAFARAARVGPARRAPLGSRHRPVQEQPATTWSASSRSRRKNRPVPERARHSACRRAGIPRRSFGAGTTWARARLPHRFVEAPAQEPSSPARGDRADPRRAPPDSRPCRTQNPYEDELRTRAAELGLVGDTRFLGWVPGEELEGLYRSSSCFVFPSLYEGFGLPVLEAMARECPSRAPIAVPWPRSLTTRR